MSLKPWREVVKPHRDVSSGRYRQAEFAADLAQVLRGSAEPEYQDPVEFFSRTYLTRGISRLLSEGLKRLTGRDAEPIIEVKTAFGGGKTHAMLSLYHLLRAPDEVAQLDHVADLLSETGIEAVPEANIAVLVGTALSATEEEQELGRHGLPVRTLWGEMAAQLGGDEAYEMIDADDEAGTAPGSDRLVQMLERFGPCLILIDELVAFVRKLYETSGATAGTFDSNLTFIQSLTEAVRATDDTLLVAAIPQSEIEIGGEGGTRVLEHVEHTFGRIQAVWRAADALEGFEIVRRRLFGEIEDEEAREATCRAFHRMYCDGGSDFPIETQESDYLERLRRAYPIHPEVFDRLYEDWGALQRFQRTRGVLRLLAAVIHELWASNDQSLLILPAALPIYAQPVQAEFMRYLPDPWTSVIDADVDGENSEPYRLDQESPRFGATSAARRVSRSIFLGSAPSVEEQRVRGMETVRVTLSVTQPDDQIAVYNDALGRLGERLTHLYERSGRYWFDDQPTLRKVMEDRAQGFDRDEVLAEIERRLRDERPRGVFRGVHQCPASADVPDEQQARLVILGPEETHRNGRTDTPALAAAREILENRGNLPRQRKNMLLFVAPDQEIEDVHVAVREYLAWKSIVSDREELNLDAHQSRQAEEGARSSSGTVDTRLRSAYRWLLIPEQEGTEPIQIIPKRIPGTDGIVEKASAEAQRSELVIQHWAPELLRLELDKWLWQDQPHINTEQLWDYLTTYCYLPRLKDQSVLLSAIREGSRSREWFGYATGIAADGTYENLVMGEGIAAIRIDSESVLVKPEVAQAQLEAEGVEVTGGGGDTGAEAGEEAEGTTAPGVVAPAAAPTRFYGTVKLDSSRVGGDAARIAEEVVQHLVGLLGADVTVTLDIDAQVEDGFPQDVIRTVSENARTLGFDQQGFEGE